MSADFDLNEQGFLSEKAVKDLQARYRKRLTSDAKKLARRGLKAKIAEKHPNPDGRPDPAQKDIERIAPQVEAYLMACHQVWRIPEDSAVISAIQNNEMSRLIRDVKDPMPKREHAKYMGWLQEPQPEPSIWAKRFDRVRNFLLRRKPDMGPIDRRTGKPYRDRQSWFMARKDVPPGFEADQARIYLPLDPDFVSPEQSKIVAALETAGYSDIDYKGGYATDDRKNRVKLGKVLKKLDNDLFEAFQRDGTRASDKNVLVVSRHPEDIARCSTGRAWSSCMDARKNWNFDPNVLADIRLGTVVAYLAKDTDPNLTDPLARILVKPMTNEQGDTIWVPERIAYGLDSPVFKHTVANHVDQVMNAGKSGRFSMSNELYADSISTQSWRFDQGEGRLRGKDALEVLGVEYTEREDGTLVVDQSIDLNRRGLSALPDLSDVVLNGDLILTNNRLKNLDGCPRVINGCLEASYNELETLEGGPEKVFVLTATHNKLTSLKGGPSHVRDHIGLSSNRLTSLEGFPQKTGVEGRSSELVVRLEQNSLQSLEGMTNINGPLRLEVSGNQLTDLTGLPEQISVLIADRNKLTCLTGLKAKKMRHLDVGQNPLTDISDLPVEIERDLNLRETGVTLLGSKLRKVGGTLNVSNCTKLTELGVAMTGDMGCLRADNAGLLTLKGLPKVSEVYAKGTNLQDLQGIDNVTTVFDIEGLRLETDMLKNPDLLKSIAQPAPQKPKPAVSAVPKAAGM
ncbi:MAG: hypothetical protein Alpg2KO_05550 [Alphaproteobacteria bacterium]